MKYFYATLSTVLVAALSFVCIEAGMTFKHADAAIAGKSKAIDATLTKVNQNMDDTHRLILEASLTAREARLASAEERQALPQLTAGVQQAIGSLNSAVATLQTTANTSNAQIARLGDDVHTVLVTTNATVANLQPVEDHAAQSIAELQVATKDIEAVVNNNDLRGSLANLNTTTFAVSGMAEDTRQYWHGVLHPSWPRRVWGFISGTGVTIATHLF